MTSELHTAAVIGLGLVGGSIARDLAARGVRVIAHDTDSAALDAAHAEGVLHRTLDPAFAGISAASLVVVAVPVSSIADVLARVAKHVDARALIVDVGSTKKGAIAAAERTGAGGGGVARQFVGSHPMTGDHRSGWSASRRGMFVGTTVYLCPTGATSADALANATRLWELLGALPTVIDAATHDVRVAYASHLPHAASAALALVLADAGIDASALGPGGRDMLRIAGSSPEIWSSIAAENADVLLRAMRELRNQLGRFEQALASRDESALHSLFADARAWTSAPSSAAQQ